MLRFKLITVYSRYREPPKEWRYAIKLSTAWISIAIVTMLTLTIKANAQSLTQPISDAAINNSERALSLSSDAIANGHLRQPESPLVDPDAQERALSESKAAIEKVRNPGWSLPTTKTPSLFGGLVNNPAVDIDALSQSGHALQELSETSAKRYDSRILIFVSSSMPEATLRNYVEQAAAVKAAIVLRGLVGESLLSTRDFLYTLIDQQQVSRVDKSHLQNPDEHNDARDVANRLGLKIVNPGDIKFLIDPTLFSRFDVQEAPTLIVAETDIEPCQTKQCAPPEHYRVRGDVSLGWALALVTRHTNSPALKKTLRPLVKRLEGLS